MLRGESALKTRKQPILVRVGPTLALVVASLCAVACSTPDAITPAPESDTRASGPNAAGIGSVTLSLTTGPGLNVTALNWAISGPYAYSGNANIGDAQSFEFVVGGVNAGNGYTITLSGTDSQNDPCTGTSAPFNVIAGATTYTEVSVTCLEPTDATLAANVTTGAVAVEAGVTVVVLPPLQCPGIMSLSSSPAEIVDFVGQTSALAVTTTNANATISWTVSPTAVGGVAGGATVANPSAASTTLTCSTPGQYQVTVSLGLPDSGECGGLPYTSMSALINCEDICGGASLGTECGDAGQICNGIGNCMTPSFSVVAVALKKEGALGAGAGTVSIEHRSLAGALLGTITLPAAASDGGSPQPFTLTGDGIAEGDLTLSVAGHHLAVAGYQAAAGTASIQTSAVAREVATIATDGGVTTMAFPSGVLAGGGVLSTVTLDGNEFWTNGTAVDGGIWYLQGGAADPVASVSSPVLTRWLRISGSQLYTGLAQDAPGLFQVGTGLPTTGAGVSLASLPGYAIQDAGGTPSPYGFVFLNVNGVQTLYVADDRKVSPGGLSKWTLSGGTWTQAWSVFYPGSDGGAAGGFRGLTGYATGSTVTLMATSGLVVSTLGATPPDQLVLIVDNGGPPPTPVVLATAPANTTYRGIAISPF